jgi:hypothetical protein
MIDDGTLAPPRPPVGLTRSNLQTSKPGNLGRVSGIQRADAELLRGKDEASDTLGRCPAVGAGAREPPRGISLALTPKPLPAATAASVRAVSKRG